MIVQINNITALSTELWHFSDHNPGQTKSTSGPQTLMLIVSKRLFLQPKHQGYLDDHRPFFINNETKMHIILRRGSQLTEGCQAKKVTSGERNRTRNSQAEMPEL